jgi:hypothetical protein
MGAEVAHIVSAWRDWFLVNAWGDECRPRKRARLAVVKGKRVGHVLDMSPLKSFGAIGITTGA